MLFKNRHHAGQELAARLSHLHGANAVALALPRGGVPVAFEIAEALDCSIGTVMSRLFYARKKLQNMLRDVYENV